MLQHQDENPSQQGQAAPAAQRVTPEELSEALAALEARREEESRRLSATVPIGEAVKELGLDATPEEIWRQVEAQRARPPAPPEPKLADTINEALHTAAQQAHKLAGQAGAAATAAVVAAAQTQNDARQNQKRRTGGGAFATVIALAVVGSVWFNSAHGLMINGDHKTTTYAGSHGAAVVMGDHDALTFAGDCSTLTVLGDHDNITITGKVQHITNLGDSNTIRWMAEDPGQAPSITDLGDSSRIERAPVATSPAGPMTIPPIPAAPDVPDAAQ